jgi:hypothetical protein
MREHVGMLQKEIAYIDMYCSGQLRYCSGLLRLAQACSGLLRLAQACSGLLRLAQALLRFED